MRDRQDGMAALLDDNGDPSALHCDHRPIPVSLLHDTSRSA
jgi:hypothetical protein